MAENGASEVAHYDLPERRLELVGAALSRRLEHGKGIWRLELPRDQGEPLVVEQLGGPVTPPADVARVLPAFLRGANPERYDPASTNGRVHSSDDAIGRLRSMLERQYAQILRHDPGVRLDLDPEDVHGVRVAVRRSRAILRAARPVLDPSWSEPLRDELHWLGSALGRRRDLDVLVRHLQGEIEQLEQPERTAAASLVELLAAERETAQAIALDALTSDRYYWLLDGLESAVRGPRVQRGEVSLRELAKHEFKRLRKAAERLGPDATDDELHRLRILGKRARYTAELAEPEVGKAGADVRRADEDLPGRARRPPGRDRRRGAAARPARRLARLGRGLRGRPPGRARARAPSPDTDGAAAGLARRRARCEDRLGVIVYLVRHARAGHRETWRARTTACGRSTSAAVARRRLSSPSWPSVTSRASSRARITRCVQTVEPLAAARGLPVEAVDSLAEGAGEAAALELFHGLEAPAVACVHGDLVEALVGESAKKSATLVLDVSGERVEVLERLDPPA